MTFASVSKRVQNYSYENVCHCTFIRAPSEKEANDNSEEEVQSAIRAVLILVSVAWSDQEYFYHGSLGWDASPSRVTHNIKFASTHLYTWLERGTVRVKCLAQEHNTMSPARAWTQTAWNRKETQKSNNRLFTQTANKLKMDNNLFWLELEHCYYINLYMM